MVRAITLHGGMSICASFEKAETKGTFPLIGWVKGVGRGGERREECDGERPP